MDARLRGIVRKAKPPAELRPAIEPLLETLKASLVSKRLYEDVFSTPEDAEAFAISKALPPDQTRVLLLMQKSKSIYVPNVALDRVLTLVFLSQCLLVVLSLHRAGELTLFLALLALADSVITRMKDVGASVGSALSTWLHTHGFVAVDPLSGPIQLKKWKDQCWQLGVHILCTAVELHILSVEPWYDDPTTCWSPSLAEQHDHHSMELKLLYFSALAIWIYTCVLHRFFDERKKDYFVMYLHHIVTIGLVGLSWHADLLRVGMLVMYVHDVSDIFIDLLKLLNLLKLEGARGWFASEVAYIAAIAAWFYYRLYEYPFRVLHSSFVLAYRTRPRSFNDGGPFGLMPPDLPLLLYNNILLGLLLVMHVYWCYLLLRVGYRLVTESALQASRMEYEGDSDCDEAGARPLANSRSNQSFASGVTDDSAAGSLSPSAAVLALGAASGGSSPASAGGVGVSPRRTFVSAK